MTTREMESTLTSLMEANQALTEQVKTMQATIDALPEMPDYKADIHDAIEGLRGDIMHTVETMAIDHPAEPQPAPPTAPEVKTAAELLGLKK